MNRLKCRSCNQNYDEDHVPKLLPCGHCLCNNCIGKITDPSLKSCFECKKSWRKASSDTFLSVSQLFRSEGDVSKCEACSNSFDKGNLKPLLPKCGHVICNRCVHMKNLTDQKDCRCPTCNSALKTNMPVVLDLIPNGATLSESKILPALSGTNPGSKQEFDRLEAMDTSNPGMNPINRQCRSCNQNYDENHIPKLLPCGHCLCKNCIGKIKDPSLKSCFECKKSWRNASADTFVSVNQLFNKRPGSPTGSSTSSQECVVCCETFDNGDCAPLLAKCSHVACRQCVLSMATDGQYQCHYCRAKLTTDPEKMPVVKDLIPRGASSKRSKTLPGQTGTRNKKNSRRRNPSPTDDKKANIFVRNMASSGTKQMYQVSLQDTVGSLMNSVEQTTRVGMENQSLMHEGNYLHLDRTRTLASHGLRSGSEITQTARLTGG